jgi:DNA-binding PadR family transcriptional regulator
MSGIERVTRPTLDVLEVLLKAHQNGRDIHGWEIKKATRRSGPTIYGVFDRLEDAGLIEGHWEHQGSSAKGPRRRYYRLTGAGVTTALVLLADWRGQQSQTRVQPLTQGLVVDFGRLA